MILICSAVMFSYCLILNSVISSVDLNMRTQECGVICDLAVLLMGASLIQIITNSTLGFDLEQHMCQVLNRIDWWSRLAKSRQTNIYNRYSRLSTAVIDLVVWSLTSPWAQVSFDKMLTKSLPIPGKVLMWQLCKHCVFVCENEWMRNTF